MVLRHDYLPSLFSASDSLGYHYAPPKPTVPPVAVVVRRSCTFFATCFVAKVGLGLGAAAFLCDRDKVLPIAVIVFTTSLPILGFAAVTDIIRWACSFYFGSGSQWAR